MRNETMVGLAVFANWVLPLLYLALLLDYGASFFLRTRAQVRSYWLPAVAAVHVLFLVLLALRLGHLPMVSNYEILSILALATAVVYWVVEMATRERRTGAFVLLLVFLFQYTASTFLARPIIDPSVAEFSTQSNWARLHILPAVVTYTACGVSAVYGLLHVIVRRNLKRHYFGPLFDRLPPLDLLGRMTWCALLAGFVFMTLTVLTGPIIFSHAGVSERVNVSDPKVIAKIVAGLIAWMVYGAAVLGKTLGRWPASRVSVTSVIGFLVVMAMLAASTVLS